MHSRKPSEHKVLILYLMLLMLVTGCGQPAASDPGDLTGKIAAIVGEGSCPNGIKRFFYDCIPKHVQGDTTIHIIEANIDEYSLKDYRGQDWWAGWDCPRWSPDGNQLSAVNWDRMQNSGDALGYVGDLYVVNADGSELTKLTTTNSCAAWSPDGQSLIFSREDNLRILNVATRDQTVLTQSMPIGTQSYYWSPDWSPDGFKLVYSTDDSIYEVNIDGTHATQLTGPHKGCRLAHPRYSPNGEQIVFHWFFGVDDNRNGIYLMNKHGSNIVHLHNGWSPTWSSDGKKIVFVDDNGIQIMNPDGTGKKSLIPHQSLVHNQSLERYYGIDYWGP